MTSQDYLDQLLKESDFSKIVEIRARFKKEHPKEFEEYMKNIAKLHEQPWISLCISCQNWQNNRCGKNLTPIPLRKMSDKQEYFCPSWTKRV